MTRQVSETPSKREQRKLFAQLQSLVFFLPPMTTLNLVEVSAHLSHLPHATGHISFTPVFLHLLLGTVAAQEQSLKRYFPLSNTRKRSEESTQLLEDGVGVVAVGLGALPHQLGGLLESPHTVVLIQSN